VPGEGCGKVEERDRDSVTKVEMVTVEHHLVGYVKTGGRRFSSWLNLGDSPAMRVENLALKSLHDLGRPEVYLRYAVVNREAILAVIPREVPIVSLNEERQQRPLEYVVKEQHEIVVSVPPFAVRGQLHITRSADLQRAVMSFAGTFMPLTEARIVYTPNPKAVWQGNVILVNRDKAQLYWSSSESEE
jgi:hypothetical protein